jgi:transposase
VTARQRPVRALQVARRGAVKARTQAGNQLRDLILTAPEQLRDKLAALTTPRRVTLAARFRPGDLASPAGAAKAAMAAVARRHQALTAEIAQLDTSLEALARHAAPAGFLARAGIGTQVASILLTTAGDNPGRLRTEASFAALCGSSPVDASSGKQRRHRLNRGGDRQANSALWRIVFTRMACDPRTQAYVARRTAGARPGKRSCAASSGTSPARSTRPWSPRPATPRPASRSHRPPEPDSTQATRPARLATPQAPSWQSPTSPAKPPVALRPDTTSEIFHDHLT